MLLKNKIKVERVVLPTPYPIGDVFCYIILDDPVTVIDMGVKTEEVEEIWKATLSRLGLSFKDVKRVLLTHGHSDHFGFARRFLELSGAVLYLHPNDFNKVINRKEYYLSMDYILKELGVPEDYFPYFEAFLEKEGVFCENLSEDLLNPIVEGEEIEFEHFSLKVIHTPGHSSGHVIFLIEDEAFTGDLIFSNMTPDPIIDVENGVRIKTSLLYFKSIEKVLSLGVDVFYPSHREEEGKFLEAVENLRVRYEIKERIIYDVLKEKGFLTPFQLACELYPEVAPKEIFIILSDVIGRLDIMEEKGIVVCQKRDGLFYYCLS